MGLFISLVVGGLVGWLCRMLLTGRPPMSMATSVAVGALGALLSAWLLSPLLGLSAASQDSVGITPVMVAVVGALVLRGVIDFGRRLVSR